MEQRDHWLRLNAANRVPRRLVSLNAQARAERSRRQVRFVFRAGAGLLDLLDPAGRPTAEPEQALFASPAELWRQVAAWTSERHRTVCFAYDLGYFLQLTEALRLLPELGFEPSRIVLSSYTCWARFAQGKRSLMLCDLRSWLPVPPAAIAADLDRPPPRRPPAEADDAAWGRYARRNAELIRAATRNLVEWLHDDDLGDFRPTGPAQASAAFRHRFLKPRTILVHWGGESRAAERRAAWAGRAEVWRHGIIEGPLYEYDYTAAYAWIAEHEQLPTRLLGRSSILDRHAPIEPGHGRRRLYELQVETAQPVLPAELEGRILWPVGSFQTIAWDVEAVEAVRAGAQVTLRACWLYEASPVLRAWARWVLAALDGELDSIDPLRRRVVKAWSRSLIGRFALRYPDLVPIGAEDEPAVRIATMHDARRGLNYKELQVGREVWEIAGTIDSADSSPQIMSAIMAHARVRLWRTMLAAGLENVAYVDTDSVLVNAAGAARLDRQLGARRFPGLRRKGTYSRADLRAPRHLELDEQRRIAGLPRTAAKTGPDRYEADVWEGIGANLRRQRPSGAFKLTRSFQLAVEDHRRLHLPGGVTAAIELRDGARAS